MMSSTSKSIILPVAIDRVIRLGVVAADEVQFAANVPFGGRHFTCAGNAVDILVSLTSTVDIFEIPAAS
jgi:hypothetical protein